MHSSSNASDNVTSYIDIISHLRRGDHVFLDIDEVMLIVDPLTKQFSIRNPDLFLLIQQLQEMGVLVYGLTRSDNETVNKKKSYLISHDIALNSIVSSHDDASKSPFEIIKEILSQHQIGHNQRMIVISGSPDMITEIKQSYRQTTANAVNKNIKLLCYHYNAPQNLSLDNKMQALRHPTLQSETGTSQQVQPSTTEATLVGEVDAQSTDEQAAPIFPVNLNEYVFVESLGGGTKSTFLIQHKTSGHKLVIKAGASQEHIQLEILSNSLYKALGVRTPRLEVYSKIPLPLLRKLKEANEALNIRVNGIYQVCEYVEPTVDNKSEAVRSQVRNSVANHFIVHALLGNIDIAKYDNMIAVAGGYVYMIDAGTNFIFRAKGDLRIDDLEVVSEVDSLRDGFVNNYAAEWFGQLTDDDIRKQIISIIQNINAIEKVVWEVSADLGLSDELRLKYVETFSKRFDYLVGKYCPELQDYAKVDKASQESITSAGVMTYAYINDVPHILLTKRKGHQWYDNFGGKSDKDDIDVINTAIREVAEESSNSLNYTRQTLLSSPFHDQIREDGRGNYINYRMYIVEHDHVDSINLNEHTDMVWIPVATVLEALNHPTVVQSENQTTISIVDPVTGKSILIFPPLLTVLENREVQTYLHAIHNKKATQAAHTQSVFSNNRSASSVAPSAAAAPMPTSAVNTPSNTKVAESLSSPRERQPVKARPLASPDSVKNQITQTTLNRIKVIKELNEKNASDAESRQAGESSGAMPQLSQSEIHMKAVLKEKYVEGDVEANVRQMLSLYQTKEGVKRFNVDESLVNKCIAMLQNEKNNGTEYVYFYHSCNSQIAFCYNIYQKIYASLHANNKWSAFRVNLDNFKKFNNIHDFAAYYASIDNNAQGYADLALSTNVFLFGNYQESGSSSIDYMVKNKVMRAVEVEKMLTDALLPLSVDKKMIESLVTYYRATFESQHGSEMYQIIIPKSDVFDVSYPSVIKGKESRFEGERDISKIITVLNERVASQNIDANVYEYINQMQARWYASPAKYVKSYKTSWHIMSSPEQEKINADKINNRLDQFADNILAQVLTNSPNDSVLDSNASAFRIVRDVNKLNQVPISGLFSSKDAFARLILTSNEHNIKKFLFKNPTAISEPITYVSDTAFNTVNIDNLSPLMTILLYSSVSLTFLNEIFGDKWYLNEEINKIVPLNEKDIYAALDPSDKLPYLREFKAVISYQGKLRLVDPKDFISILTGLPLNQRTRLVQSVAGKPRFAYLFTCPESDNKLLKGYIETLETLPEKDRKSFYLEYKPIFSALYINFNFPFGPIMSMKLFSALLSSPELILENHQNCIEALKSCSFDHFFSTLRGCPIALRPAMFDLIKRPIQSDEELKAILSLIPVAPQNDFKLKYASERPSI